MVKWIVATVGKMFAAGCATKIETVAVASVVAPSAVAAAFMRAVADSNFSQMGDLWGTSGGSALASGKPANWLQRVAVMHAYLKGGAAKVVGESPGSAKGERRVLLIELARDGCVKTVPFTMIRTKQGSWLVNAVDLNAAGVPGRSCERAKGT